MKCFITLVIVLFLVTSQQSTITAQVIRKNYREMTAAEKQILVNALVALGPRTTTGTTVNNYALNHSQLNGVLGNQSIHQVDDFLPWHRWFILYFEKALQNTSVTGASKISLPYWDWTSKYYSTSPTDYQKTSPLWEASFLGQFNSLWSLGRSSSTSVQIGTDNQLGGVLLQTNITTFRNQLEGWGSGNLFHNNGHVWVGGIMTLANSPGDPAFFLHHAMVDKVWQDWTNLGRTTSFSDEILPNKGGSSVTNFPTGVPQSISPSSIIDGRANSVKVWYAENGKVILDKYTVTGTENYYYTGIIEAGSRVITSVTINSIVVNYLTGNFIVPSGTTCNFTSGGLQMGSAPASGDIRLVPGFSANAGSNFSAKINSDYFTDASVGGRYAEDNLPPYKINLNSIVTIYPNPSKGIFYVEFLKGFSEPFEFWINNSFGKVVAKGQSIESLTPIDLTNETSGIYIITIRTNSGSTVRKTMIINQ